MYRQSLSEDALPLIGIALSRSSTNVYNEEILPLRQNRVNSKYPVAVIFVLVAKFFEAFAVNGIRTILALYLRDDLSFTESLATIMLHVFNFFGQFCPIFGAILADSYIGNVRTISYFCILYGIGWICFITTTFSLVGIPVIFLVSLSLLCISIGNGSIRACITSLGAMQFKLPEQDSSLVNYFSHYYFVYYIGIFLSKILPPLIRAKTECFNKIGCYPAVFGVLGSSFLVSWIIFGLGKLFYKEENPAEENILLEFYGCVRYALVKKFKNTERKSYWLYYSIGKYSKEFVNDVQTFFQVSKLFIPLTVYYSLLAQQDSSWTFQATQMNTTLFGMRIEPDQAKAMGPVFLFTMIPLWQYIFVPLLKYFGIIIHPLNSVAIGGLCSAFAFVCAGLLQISIENELPYSVNIAWQIPQFILLMLGELFLSIPGLQFAFTQAPQSMKSVLTAAWFLNNAFGNLIVIIITKLNLFQLQSSEYFIYSILMFISIIIFTSLACDYLKQNLSQTSRKNNEPDRFTESQIITRRHSYHYGSIEDK